MAFLGDFGKFFGLGSSKEVLGDVGGTLGRAIGLEGAGRKAGEFLGQATSSIGGGSDINLSSLSTACLLYTSPSPRDATLARMPSSA